MDDRSDSGGAILAIGVVLILLLLLVGGGGFFYLLVSRQQAMVMAETSQARAAESQARMNLERARTAQESAVAQAAAAEAAARTDAQKPNLAGSTDGAIRASIEALLVAQEQAWNAGDIDQFMEHYWKSDELTFSSGGQTTRGWTATLNRYRERYPTPEKMGKLDLDRLEITPLGDAAALVLGEWRVEREPEPLSGNFSLVVRKMDDRWRIIHDHTSRLESILSDPLLMPPSSYTANGHK